MVEILLATKLVYITGNIFSRYFNLVPRNVKRRAPGNEVRDILETNFKTLLF